MQVTYLVRRTTHCEAFFSTEGLRWIWAGECFERWGEGFWVFSRFDVGLAWLFHIERVVSVKESVNRLLTC